MATATLDRPASPFIARARPLAPEKFRDPEWTAKGEPRAHVAPERLETLWLNTGTLCNLACASCYIESSPRNDALVYLSLAEAERYLDEAAVMGTRTIGFTGGEPFMNPHMLAMMEAALGRGFDLLILTNAMQPMRRFATRLAAFAADEKARIVMRVSLDHHSGAMHEAERGTGTWAKALDGLRWLEQAGFPTAVAGRQLPGETAEDARMGYAALFAEERLEVCEGVVIFPPMDETADVPEISDACWGILGQSPSAMMCASSRMVVKHRGAAAPHVVACTLIPYDPGFAMGSTLAEAWRPIALNHPHCAKFCVLGGASCSG